MIIVVIYDWGFGICGAGYFIPWTFNVQGCKDCLLDQDLGPTRIKSETMDFSFSKYT